MAVSFDGPNKRIVLALPLVGSTGSITAKDLYSEWKSWTLVNDNSKYLPAMRAVGGDPISDVRNLGSTYFVTNGWRIRPQEADHWLRVEGNLFTDPAGASPFVRTLGDYNVTIEMSVSNLSDASLAQMPEIEYASFNYAVNVDTNNVTGRAIAGTAYPAGTVEHPSNNIDDAFAIRTARGFGEFHIYGNLDLDSGIAWDVEGMVFHGDHAKVASVDIHPQSLTRNCVFRNLTVTGTLDGNNVLEDCIVGDLEYVEGELFRSELLGIITLGGTGGVHLRDCYSGALSRTFIATIDMGGSGRNCAVHRFSGHIRIQNLTGNNVCVVTANAGGYVEVADTCTAGTVLICGVGLRVENNATGTCQVNTDYNVVPPALVRGRSVEHFHVLMVQSGDHRSPATGLTITATLSKDTGAFAPITNAVVEVGQGIYDVSLTAAETNCTSGTLRLSAPGADTRYISIVTAAAH